MLIFISIGFQINTYCTIKLINKLFTSLFKIFAFDVSLLQANFSSSSTMIIKKAYCFQLSLLEVARCRGIQTGSCTPLDRTSLVSINRRLRDDTAIVLKQAFQLLKKLRNW